MCEKVHVYVHTRLNGRFSTAPPLGFLFALPQQTRFLNPARPTNKKGLKAAYTTTSLSSNFKTLDKIYIPHCQDQIQEMEEAARGASALEKSDFALAITHYTKAIATNPTAVDYYIKRSTAYTRLSPADHAAALKDAELAVVLAHKRGKRELLWQSQLRRAIALFGLGRWGDAKACFKWVEKLNKDEKSLTIWFVKVEGKLKGLAEDDERGTTTLTEIPEVDSPKEEVKKGKEPEQVWKNDDGKATTSPASTDSKPKPEGVKTPAGKIRHEWYQTTDHVVVTLFAKGVPKDKATIDIQPKSLSISFPMPNSSEFEFSLDPLYSSIEPSASSAKIMSTKAEFTLKKSTAGEKWHSLEGSERTKPSEPSDNKTDSPSSAAIKTAVLGSQPPLPSSVPAYPTSSKSGPKNWDKLASELTKKPTKKKKRDATTADGKNDDEGGDGDDDGGAAVDDDLDGSDPVQGFFQKIYKDADPDTRRAMIKSYQESNGTSLSTNWSEVAKGPVETSPPDGMVAKKWME